MSAESILTTVRQHLGIDPTVRVTIEPIKRGASGRTIVRVKAEGKDPFIGIHWTDERPDNDFYVPVSQFLSKAGMKVPEILHAEPRWRVALVEDLGDKDLHSLKGEPFEEREKYYRSAFQQLDKLFFTRVPKDMEFSPSFDEEMYRWEQEYFFEHLVEDLLGMDAGELRDSSELKELAEGLGKSAKNLVHRDFQSQNFLLKGRHAYWIDFQGMRRGRQEYDLASLIFDPYMDHSEDEREKLLDLWEDVSEERPVPKILHECAAQRLMQALGAFGNIIENQVDDWYRQHVPVAAKLLGEVTRGTKIEGLLAPVIEKAGAFE